MESIPETDMMYQRLEEYEQNFRRLSPEEKAMFFFAYSVARVDAERAQRLAPQDFNRNHIGD